MAGHYRVRLLALHGPRHMGCDVLQESYQVQVIKALGNATAATEKNLEGLKPLGLVL